MEIQLQLSPPQTKSAEIVASTVDILTEILLRLPVKSVLRFKLVSKRWFHLISDSRFCQLLNPNPNPAVGLFLPLCAANSGQDHECYGYEFIPFSSDKSIGFIKNHLPAGVRILHSCNGLMLCCSKISAVNNDPEYFVYNPTTKKLSILPKPDQTNGISKTIRGIYLAFEPVRSFHYKIISVWSRETDRGKDSSDTRFEIKVYSSETHSWQVQSQPFTSPVSFEKGVYWNNAIHWMSAAVNEDSLYFNVDSESPSHMPSLPLTYSRRCKRDHYFGVVREVPRRSLGGCRGEPRDGFVTGQPHVLVRLRFRGFGCGTRWGRRGCLLGSADSWESREIQLFAQDVRRFGGV